MLAGTVVESGFVLTISGGGITLAVNGSKNSKIHGANRAARWSLALRSKNKCSPTITREGPRNKAETIVQCRSGKWKWKIVLASRLKAAYSPVNDSGMSRIKNKAMKTIKTKLTENEINELLPYLRAAVSTSGKPVDPLTHVGSVVDARGKCINQVCRVTNQTPQGLFPRL